MVVVMVVMVVMVMVVVMMMMVVMLMLVPWQLSNQEWQEAAGF